MVRWRRIHTCCFCHRPWYVQLRISVMTVNDWPHGKQFVLFPWDPQWSEGKTVWNIKSQGETKLAVFLWGQSFKIVLLYMYMYLPTQELNELWKKWLLAWYWLKHKVAAVSRCTTWLYASWKLKLLFPYGVSECVWHMKHNDSPSNWMQKCWVGWYMYKSLFFVTAIKALTLS